MTDAANPFDVLAANYDEQFDGSLIGGLMRRAVWRRLDARFEPGHRVLELNCGTGSDALHLARRGVVVLATDSSSEMLKMAKRKILDAGLSHLITTRQLTVEQIAEGALAEEPAFDGALSDFGGLNCVSDLASAGRALAARVRTGGYAVLCLMGPFVPWEWLWFMSHGAPGSAFRRLRRDGVTWRRIQVRYPTIRRARCALQPCFVHRRTAAVGALVPPPYAESWVRRWPQTLKVVNRWERRLEAVWPLPWLADHYVVELERVRCSPALAPATE